MSFADAGGLEAPCALLATRRLQSGVRRGPASAGRTHYRDHPPYLKESETRVRNAATFPFSTFMSIFVTSATRRSRSEPAAVSTALRPASSQDSALTPTTSTIL